MQKASASRTSHAAQQAKAAVKLAACDQADASNAQAVVPYLQEIHTHYREAEARARPPPPRAAARRLRSRRAPRAARPPRAAPPSDRGPLPPAVDQAGVVDVHAEPPV